MSDASTSGRWTQATAHLSCYAQSFENGDGLRTYLWDGEPEWSERDGWSWLRYAADLEGLKAWKRKKRLRQAIDELLARHPGEPALWLRWSHPSENVSDVLRSWHRYCMWWRRKGAVVDLVAVVDRGPTGDRVWHIHAIGFGARLQLGAHAAAAGRAGFFPFVHARSIGGVGSDPPRSADQLAREIGYMLRKVKGYISAKEGARRLSLRVSAPGFLEPPGARQG